MKKMLTVAAMAILGMSLFGCASDKVSSKPDDPTIIPPIFVDPDMPIEDPGREAVITDDGKILIDNEEWGYLQEDIHGNFFVYMTDENGDSKLVGSVYKHSDTSGDYWVFSPNEGGAYFINRDANGKITVDWDRSVIDGGWGISAVPPAAAMKELSPETKAALKGRAQAIKASKADIQLNR